VVRALAAAAAAVDLAINAAAVVSAVDPEVDGAAVVFTWFQIHYKYKKQPLAQ